MNKYFNNKFSLIIISLLLFFSFNISVKAKNVYECQYDASSTGSLKLMVTQNEDGKRAYYYYNSKGKWVKIKGNKVKIEGSKDISGSCPNMRIFKVDGVAKLGQYKKYNHVIHWGCNVGTEANCYTSSNSNNSKKGKENVSDVYDVNSNLISDTTNNMTCEEILGDELIKRIQEIVNIIRIMVPILLIVFGILDFGKAIFVNDDNEMKKAQTKFIKRLIFSIGFFLIPSLLQIILNIASQVWDTVDNSLCGIKF